MEKVYREGFTLGFDRSYEKMGFVVSSLSEYFNENTEIITETMADNTTFGSGIDIIDGQKHTFKLNKLSVDVQLQAGGACTWTSSGTTSFTQETVTLCPLALMETLCEPDLNPKYIQQYMQKGSNNESLVWGDMIIGAHTESLMEKLDYLYWTGDSDNATGFLSRCDGIGAFMSGKTGVFVEAATGTTTQSNVIYKINEMVAKIPARILNKQGISIYLSPSILTLYKLALLASNLVISSVEIKIGKGFANLITVPGFDNITLNPTTGLIGSEFMYGSIRSNFVLGTDGKDDANVELFYNKGEKRWQLSTELKFGVGVKEPNLVIHNNSNL